MTFENLLETVKDIKCQETRKREKDYCEVVIAKTNLESMVSALESYFGVPLKPAGKEPSHDVQQCAKPYGGVSGDQTFFYRETKTLPELALLWPWGNGSSITVKIARGNL